MNNSMSEKEEIHIRKNVSHWQNRQTVNGNVFLFLCVASFMFLVLFVSDPGKGTACVLFVFLTLMFFSGCFLFRSAYAVDQHKQLLRCPARSEFSQHDVIDAEVIGPNRG